MSTWNISSSPIFSRKLGHHVSETTISSIKKAFIQGREKNADKDDDSLKRCFQRSSGRSVLGKELDKKVQLYRKKVREGGGVVSTRIAMAVARGILLFCDKSQLVEFGGHVKLSRH